MTDQAQRTREEVAQRTEGLDDASRRKVTCALIGHSRVQAAFFGYYSCARCGEQVGDSLGSTYRATGIVVHDHHCDECRANLGALTWQDTLDLPQEYLDGLTLLADAEASRAYAARQKEEHDRVMAELRAEQSR